MAVCYGLGWKDTLFMNAVALYGGCTDCTAGFLYFLQDFFSQDGRGSGEQATFAVKTLDALHALFGHEDNVSMMDVAKCHLKNQKKQLNCTIQA